MEYVLDGEKVITKIELANLLDVSYQTMSLYLDNYKFVKYRRINRERHSNYNIVICRDFVYDLYIYLLKKQNFTASDRLKKLYGNQYKLPTYRDFILGEYEENE